VSVSRPISPHAESRPSALENSRTRYMAIGACTDQPHIACAQDEQSTKAQMEIAWAPWYRPDWHEQPERYVEEGIVSWGRSRRLAKARDARLGLKAYIGVQHYDPERWNLPGEPSSHFFLSLFTRGRTVSLRTYATIEAALSALASFHEALAANREANREK
jgi:hypothetical protein